MSRTLITPQQIVDVALETARRQPGHIDALVSVSVGSTVNLRWARNSLTTNGTNWSTSLGVTAIVKVAGGTATSYRVMTSDNLDRSGIESFVAGVFADAASSTPVEDARPIITDLVRGDWNAPAVRTGASVFAGLTPALGDVFGAANSDGYIHYGYAEHSLASSWMASSGGIRARVDSPDGRIEMTSKSSDLARSSWTGKQTRTFGDLDVYALDRELRTRLDWQKNRIDVAAGKYDTILPPGAVGDMLSFLTPHLDGRDAHEGRSVFSARSGSNHHDGYAGTTRIGELLSPSGLHLYSDPHYSGIDTTDFEFLQTSGGSYSLFDTGLPVGKTSWIRDGRLEALVQSRFTAEMSGAPYTPDVDNLILEVPGGQGTTEDLVSGLDDGLLLNCLWYIRDIDTAVNSVTGLTRDGVYVVKGGEVVGCTTNFRFNESPLDMLARVKAAGAPELAQTRECAEYVSDLMAPALLIEGFNMSSVSDAS